MIIYIESWGAVNLNRKTSIALKIRECQNRLVYDVVLRHGVVCLNWEVLVLREEVIENSIRNLIH